ncbi:uncharacterized protein BP01DRAFT_353213 [Aspergillus saccharolyticus JOP 1030-1]|uniref:STEEP1 domain-containing protein n=1 Tax=Aspergillus saccharolyticus JOP 1030-1 TaxID=1450539 RepID=A0A318ZMR3_9EURO|nr:hypothetical protein BP01DRAFT_353213 [Aspergillus saccharolyticus JOP 1030-1]PYH48911.1 hypothetical protein BP01DRAFT_353213 [Aspergillus saccharolyticus JOP 1030-1]
MSSHPDSPSAQPPQPQLEEEQDQKRLTIRTNHCRFCNHLLLATTRNITTLPRRKAPAQDAALILPLPRDDEELNHAQDPDDEGNADANSSNQSQNQPKKQLHYTILLSTTIPDRKHTLIRREDGFEKRLLLRCGRCRVVVGYFLDAVHFPRQTRTLGAGEDEGQEEELADSQRAKVVYLLPGALMETGVMEANDVEKLRAMDRQWAGWMDSS